MTLEESPVATWKQVLEEQGRSITWLAQRTETPLRTVYAFSRGDRRPSEAWLQKAAGALGVPVALLDSGRG